VLRSILFLLVAASAAGFGQSPSSNSDPQHPAAAPSIPPQSLHGQLEAAEAAIAKSDWKTAEAKLDPWLAAHPSDARALFDAGYVADSQNRLVDAAALYRRAVEADPKSFEAQLSLGLLLARQGKLADARTALAAATGLDPGEAGPVLKARAWRALAQIDRDTDPSEASNDLLQALNLSPETPADTLLAADLADASGQFDTAEAAYRRILAKDPHSSPANAGLAHLLIARKQYPEAETLLRAALDQSPGDPALTAQLATVLVAQDKAEALPLLEKLHDAHPADAHITSMLAAVQADAGDSAASDHLYEGLLAACSSTPRPLPRSTRPPSLTLPTQTAGAAWPLPPPAPISLPSHSTLLPCDQSIFQKSLQPISFGPHPTIHCTSGPRLSPTTITSWTPPLENSQIRNGRLDSVSFCSKANIKV